MNFNIFLNQSFVLLLLLSKNVPSATDKIPLIGAYYCLNMFMIATSTCSCTIVVHIYFRGDGKIPKILRKVFLIFLAKAFCMSTVSSAKSKKKSANKPVTIITALNNNNNKNKPKDKITHYVANTRKLSAFGIQNKTILPIQKYNACIKFSKPASQSANQQFQEEEHQNHFHNHNHQKSNRLNNDLRLSFTIIENDVKEIHDYLRHTRNKFKKTDSKIKQTNEWKQFALVLDRTLFYIYLFSMIVSSTFLII